MKKIRDKEFMRKRERWELRGTRRRRRKREGGRRKREEGRRKKKE